MHVTRRPGAGPWIVLWIAVAWLAAAPAHAADDFKTHYNLALALYDAQRYDEAIGEFQKAYDKEHKPALLFNIAQCYRKSGHPKEASEFYEKYLDAEPRLDNDTRAKVNSYLSEARNTLAALELEVKKKLAEEKAKQQKDDAATPSQPEPLPVTPPVATQPPVVTQPALVVVAPPPPRPPIYRRWWFWTAIGGAVAAGVVVGAVVGTQTSNPTPSVPDGVPRATILF